MRYPFEQIELKWQKFWENEKIFRTNLSESEKKLYCLVMFIYPSGAKLHAGHWYNYGPTDSWARYKKLKGFNVFEPMGYDAFGLPAENYAIKTGIHPYDSTMKNIDDIREQLKRMGCMYDWDAELMTCKPEYYKWNQWLFLQLYKKGLAVRKKAPVNWCPKDQTVLANEQVKDGACERCGTAVVQKNLTQWFFKITDYADELLDGLEKINWPEKTKAMQQNWIGRSSGTEVKFRIDNSDDEIHVFTTRPDTLFGVTYIVLAPENPLVSKLTTPEYKDQVNKYIENTRTLTEIERTSTVKEKTGVPIGAYAINPVNNEKVPVWVADYVLATYGTGSVMAVPGHDERDFEFAKKYDLPIRKVILQEGTDAEDELTEAYTAPGIMINSGKYNQIFSEEGIIKITEDLEKCR
jgi:leucyl-tRNA synthetase